MTYVLTVLIALTTGQVLSGDAEVSVDTNCRATAEQIAKQQGATLIDFRCVLQIEV